MEFFRHQNCFTLDGGISPFASSRLWHVICRQNEKFICNKTKPFSVRSGLAVGYFHIWRDKKNKIKLYTYNCNCSSKQSLLLWCKKYRYKGVFYYILSPQKRSMVLPPQPEQDKTIFSKRKYGSPLRWCLFLSSYLYTILLLLFMLELDYEEIFFLIQPIIITYVHFFLFR